MPSLVPTAGGRPHPILRKLTSVGAGEDNDVVLRAPGVSNTHAHIKLDSGRFLLVALSPRSHPILVNGKKVKKHTLEHTDSIQIGEVTLKFNLWDEPNTVEAQREPLMADELSAYRRLADFSRRLAEQADVTELLEALMDEVVGLTGAGKGFLLIPDDEGALQVRTARNLRRQTIAATLDHVSDTILAQVMQTGAPVIVSDALNDRAFQSSASVVQLRLCSVMCVPLMFGGKMLGVIYVGNDNVVNLFDQRSLELLSVFASQAALLLRQALQRAVLAADNDRLRAALDGQRFGSIIGSCDPMKAVFRKVEKVARTDISVLVLGETGTGKELIAREIHRRSARAEGPFIAVNCGAVPENLMESELFGHRRGAFTGAVENKVGSFMAAHGGTLFLDEIGEMPLQLQVKLLRAIQERKILRVGDARPTDVDIRLVAATHVDLEAAIAAGQFREDLYYRIHVVSIELPPLRDRDQDVVVIARYLLDRFGEEFGRQNVGFSNEALIALRKHAWPGNIRELENRVKKALVLADTDELTPDDLDLTEELLSDRVLPLAEAKDAFQRRYIDQVLALNDGNRTKTARDLGVDPRTVFRHLERIRSEDELHGD